MSTVSLPSYHNELLANEQLLDEHRHRRPNRNPNGNGFRTNPGVTPNGPGSFIKNSRSGRVTLKLLDQKDDAALPEYGRGATVEGIVGITKVDGVTLVEVKIEGALKLKEVAEGGTNTSSLCLNVQTLWARSFSQSTSNGDHSPTCPTSLSFSLALPLTFNDGKADYPLPPSFEAHLSGLPGFKADIEYTVSATVHRPSSFFGIPNNTVVSTPIVYYPRSRPATPLPPSLPVFDPTLPSLPQAVLEQWDCHETVVQSKVSRLEDVRVKFYIPKSKVFCLSQPIPFHLYFQSSAMSLAAILPHAPATVSGESPNGNGSSGSNSKNLQHTTHLQLLRQTSVDVRSITKRTLNHLLPGNKTNIWKTVEVGGPTVIRRGDRDGNGWMGWVGQLAIHSPEVRVELERLTDRGLGGIGNLKENPDAKMPGGFRASGLSVKDFICMTMIPPDAIKGPFGEMRLVVPIQTTTSPWSDGSDYHPGYEGQDGPGFYYGGSDFDPDEKVDDFGSI